MTMFSASIHTWMRMDCMNSPSREPSPMPSSVVSRFVSISAEMSVEPWTSPDALAITLWLTSNTAMTILNVLERIRMAMAVLNIHL